MINVQHLVKLVCSVKKVVLRGHSRVVCVSICLCLSLSLPLSLLLTLSFNTHTDTHTQGEGIETGLVTDCWSLLLYNFIYLT